MTRGFGESARLWSDHRDGVMRKMTVLNFYLLQMEYEPAAWLV